MNLEAMIISAAREARMKEQEASLRCRAFCVHLVGLIEAEAARATVAGDIERVTNARTLHDELTGLLPHMAASMREAS